MSLSLCRHRTTVSSGAELAQALGSQGLPLAPQGFERRPGCDVFARTEKSLPPRRPRRPRREQAWCNAATILRAACERETRLSVRLREAWLRKRRRLPVTEVLPGEQGHCLRLAMHLRFALRLRFARQNPRA